MVSRLPVILSRDDRLLERPRIMPRRPKVTNRRHPIGPPGFPRFRQPMPAWINTTHHPPPPT